MPLLDHFHPPLSERRSWEGFHGMWAAAIVEQLNRDVLSEEYYADFQVHLGSQVEIDVATLSEPLSATASPQTGTAVLTAPVWSPPTTSLVLPTTFSDEIEVQVYQTTTGAKLVAAVELVSPGNKDRAEARLAFVAKCISYLARGIGLIVVDVVTNRLANLHNEVISALGQTDPYLLPVNTPVYTVAYRPSRQSGGDQIEIWPTPLSIGSPLPTLPLALLNAATVPVDLESAYSDACQRGRLPFVHTTPQR